MSLLRILNDPRSLLDNERLVKKTQEVKKDKQGILNAASDYNSRYKTEIEEGTLKKQILITDGQRRGLKEEDVMKQVGSFIPCRSTPILNFLYFMLREENMIPGFEEERKKLNKQYGHLEDTYTLSKNNEFNEPTDMENFIYGSMTGKQFATVKKLKTLSLSGKCNDAESALAFTMCKKLCEKYGLDFSKIPVNN